MSRLRKDVVGAYGGGGGGVAVIGRVYYLCMYLPLAWKEYD